MGRRNDQLSRNRTLIVPNTGVLARTPKTKTLHIIQTREPGDRNRHPFCTRLPLKILCKPETSCIRIYLVLTLLYKNLPRLVLTLLYKEMPRLVLPETREKRGRTKKE